MNEPSTFDLFFSYAVADRAWVEGYLIPVLGIPRERIITHDDFKLGAARVNEIEHAVKTSRYTILILSPAYLTDEWANLGEQLAAYLTTTEAQTRLIPLLKADCELPLRIDFRVRLDCTEQANWEHDTARLRDLLNQPAAQPERIECPYPGMLPFEVKDARAFFGRDKEIDELVRRVRLQNLLFVIGPSGSGKSSLVFAGLVAELTKRQPDTWLIKTIRPGSDPLSALNEATASAQISNHPTNQLIIIDQFEEVFTLADKSHQAAFIARLKSLRAENRCVIVATMRADFYPNLMNSDLWPLDPSERIEIAPLRGEALRQAIVKPAEHIEPAGVYLEPGLVEQLITDAADEPGVLPLVQETMVLLWEKRQWRLLTRLAYQEMGQRNLTGLAVAVATRADAVFVQLDESQRTIARRIFLRLIQFGEGRADTRRQQPVFALRASNDDPDEFDRTLKHLTDNRLLTSSGDERDGEHKIDIAHEVLITAWGCLHRWVNERREAEQTRRRLESKASEWERLGHADAGTLDPIELSEAENWLKSADAIDLGYSKTLTELIDISHAKIQQAKSEREQALQHELEQAKALAETERRSRIRQWYFTIGLAAILVLAIVAAGLAVQQRNEATRRTSLEIAANSIANHSTDPELSLLLAIESAKTANTSQAVDALRTSLLASHIRAVMTGHSGIVYRASFSPDSKFVVTASDDNTARVWKVSTGRSVAELRGHTGAVYSAVFSPDGNYVVTASADHTARLWETRTWQSIAELRGHQDWVVSASFSPNSKFVVTASGDGTARVWDVPTGRSLIELRGHADAVHSASFSPDGNLIVTGSYDHTARVWEASTGRLVSELVGHEDLIRTSEFSHDGKLIVTASLDHTARVWEARTGRNVAILRGHTDYVLGAVFSPDDQLVATASKDGTAVVWEATTGKVMIQIRSHTGPVSSAAFSPDGRFIITASDDHTAEVWDRITRQSLAELRGHSAAVRTAFFSPNGKFIATTSDDNTGRIWALGMEYDTLRLVGHSDTVWDARFSPDGKLAVTSSQDHTARVWEVNTGRIVADLRGPTEPVTFASFSPDGKLVVTASGDGLGRIWEATTGRLVAELRGHTAPVVYASFNPDGTRVVTASRDGTARVWETGTGQSLVELHGHKNEVWSAALSLDGNLVVTASLDGTARVWDVATGRLVAELLGHTAPVVYASFNPDGTRVVTASQDGTARVWETRSGKEIVILAGHMDTVNKANFSSDGKWIITASGDGTGRIWDATTGRALVELRGHTNSVWTANLSLDNRFVVTASEDGTARVWEADSGQSLAVLSGHSGPVKTAVFSRDGKLILTSSKDATAQISACEVCGSLEDLLTLARAHTTRDLTVAERVKYLHEGE